MTMSSPPELPTEEASSPNRISSPRVAETILRESAADIGFNDDEHLDQIMKGFRNQYITEEWQLSMLGDGHWERLNVPIGLSLAIRKRLQQAQSQQHQENGEFLKESNRNITSSRHLEASSSFHARPKKKDLPSLLVGMSQKYTVKKPNNTVLVNSQELLIDESIHFVPPLPAKEEPGNSPNGNRQEDTDVPMKEKIASKPSDKQRRRAPMSLRQILSSYKTPLVSRPFPATQLFRRGLLHAKSGEELKANTVFFMELSVVISAFLTGACVEMWVSRQDVKNDESVEMLAFTSQYTTHSHASLRELFRKTMYLYQVWKILFQRICPMFHNPWPLSSIL